MKHMKKKEIFCISLTVLMVFLSSSLFAKDFISLGSGDPGGTWYHIGNGISKVLNDHNRGWKMAPEATAGGTENLRRVARGELDLGITHITDLLGNLKQKQVSPNDFRLLMAAHVSIAHFVVLKNSRFGRDDLAKIMTKGIRIGAGEPGSAIGGIVKTFFTAYGLKLEDAKVAYISQSEQVNAIKDGVIEVAALGSGLPVPAAMDLATTKGIHIINIPDDVVDKLRALSPVFVKYVIPPGVYPGVDKSVNTFGIPAYLIVKKDLDEETVYKITKGILEYNKEIAKIHRAGLEYNTKDAFNYMETLLKLGCNFHPGAIRYYKEKGLWKN
ncbi:MAG: TAXI family TRAP transporter solute-binding subunit [Deltaproteobacteria bacterium]|nr:TAXI family TRAP transporter solute-binding subunit [Deltaproteobacteria bacterium]